MLTRTAFAGPAGTAVPWGAGLRTRRPLLGQDSTAAVLLIALMCLAIFGMDFGGIGMGPETIAGVAPSVPRRAPAGVRFEQNRGQTDPTVAFTARAGNLTVFLRPQEAVFRINRAQNASGAMRAGSPAEGGGAAAVVRMRAIGASPVRPVQSGKHLPGTSNYFIGRNPAGWTTGVAAFGQVRYPAVYPGIDWVYHSKSGGLEHDFVVAPGANPNQIRLDFSGQTGLSLDRSGALVAQTAAGPLRQHRPAAYQWIGGRRSPVRVEFKLRGSRVGFTLGRYDHSRRLIIDPEFTYSTYLGGSGYDEAHGIAVDSAGAAYVAGTSASTNFPHGPDAPQGALSGSSDAYIAKLSPSGRELVWATYLGGSSADGANSLAVDESLNTFVTGSTSSIDFPVTSSPKAVQSIFGGSTDAFVARLNPEGTGLSYATYLGGAGDETGWGIAARGGKAYVTGQTASPNFPVAPLSASAKPLQATLKGTSDAFVSSLGPLGDSLVYSTYLGGAGVDGGRGIALRPGDTAPGEPDVYVTGMTKEPTSPGPLSVRLAANDFPTTPNTLRSTPPGLTDSFATKLTGAGPGIGYSTYLGGNDQDGDIGGGIAVDNHGNAYVVGVTRSANFPVTSGAFQPTLAGSGGSKRDAYLTELSPDAKTAVFSTFLGGASFNEYATGVAVDSLGRSHVTGSTDSPDFPTRDPLQGRRDQFDAFLTTFKPGGALRASTYLGGPGTDQGYAIAISPNHPANPLDPPDVYVGGLTYGGLPTTLDAYQSAASGGGDAFVARIASPPAGPAAQMTAQSLGVNQPSAAAGTGFKVTVTLKDSLGRIADGYRGTVVFGSSDPRATLPPAYSFVEGDGGIHTFENVALANPGTQTLTVTDLDDGNLSTTLTFSVVPGPAARLDLSGIPDPAPAGVPIDVIITARDLAGNVAETFGDNVYWDGGGSGGCAQGPEAEVFTPEDRGVRVLEGLIPMQVGNCPIQFSNGIITGGTTLHIVPGPARTLELGGFPASAEAGEPKDLTVKALDSLGNPAAGYRGTVHLSSTDPSAQLPSDYTFTEADNGEHTIGPAALRKAGQHIIQVTDTLDSAIIGQTDVAITPAAVSDETSTVTADPASVDADGETESRVTVTLNDAYLNPISEKHVTLTKQSGPGEPIIGEASGPTDESGTAFFMVASGTVGKNRFKAVEEASSTTAGEVDIDFLAYKVSAAASQVTAKPKSVPADGKTASTVTVVLKDAQSNPIEGKEVALTKSSGPGHPHISPDSQISDKSGTATFQVASDTEGSATFLARNETDFMDVGTTQVRFEPVEEPGQDDQEEFFQDNTGARAPSSTQADRMPATNAESRVDAPATAGGGAAPNGPNPQGPDQVEFAIHETRQPQELPAETQLGSSRVEYALEEDALDEDEPAETALNVLNVGPASSAGKDASSIAAARSSSPWLLLLATGVAALALAGAGSAWKKARFGNPQ